MKVVADKKHRIWKSLLTYLSKRKKDGFTVYDIVDETGIGQGSVTQCLKRLRTWGYIRPTAYQSNGGAGRRRNVFEVTEHGMSKVDYENKS